MPTDQDDDDHDVISAIVGTTTVAPGSSQTEVPSRPSDHPDRPVNVKPSSVISTTISIAETATPTSVVSIISSATATALPTTTSSPSSDHFLPSYFPTFGVSKRTQVWIYGATSVIIVFCAALGTFFCVQRRRRARTNRADYEFEMLGDQDRDGATHGVSDGRRVKRRAGELYDAFAGESDEELLSDGEVEEAYKDEEPKRAEGAKPPEQLSEK